MIEHSDEVFALLNPAAKSGGTFATLKYAKTKGKKIKNFWRDQMKIKIGSYKNWWGPYQIADLLQWVGFSEDTCLKIGDKSPDWVTNLCEWVASKRRRKIKIKIHDYDVWGMDHTLALIIHPMLIKLKETKQGSPYVESKDLPEHLQFDDSEGWQDNDIDWHTNWDWVLDEMIWSFGEILDEEGDSQFFTYPENYEFDFANLGQIKIDSEGLEQYNARILRGTTLFGKYFQGLWD